MSTRIGPTPAISSQALGTGFVLAATIAWSFSGTFTRLLTTDAVTAIAWRSFFGGAFLLIPHLLQHRGRGLSAFCLSGPGCALAAAQVLCQASTVGAFYKTSVANVAVIYATAPFMAAALAFWLIGERMASRTLIASLVALAGVVLIVSHGFGTGHIAGDLIAVLMTTTFALIIVIPRAYPGSDREMMPATIISAAVTFAIFAPFGHAAGLPGADWLDLAGFGFTNFTLAMYLFLAGSRRIAAAQAALIGTLEIVLSPVWAWLVFSERPSWATVVGGTMILTVVAWHAWRDLRAHQTCSSRHRPQADACLG